MVQKMKKKLSDMLTARKENSNKGFTLVELIVVIVILAILIGVTIGGVFGYVNKSRINTDINNAAAIQSACATLATDSNVAKAANAGTYTLTWNGTETTPPTFSSDITVGSNTKYLKTKLDELLTGDLPKAKAGGCFELEVEVKADGIVVISCKALDSNGTLLEAQE